MRVDRRFRVLIVLGFLLDGPVARGAETGEPVRITVEADAPGQLMAPTMHGLFFEDINYAADGGLYWWNIGGWRNAEHSLQGEGVTERHVRGSVETNRWYDVRLELRGAGVKAYLDGRLVHEDERKPVPAVPAAAGRDRRAGDLVLQVVNPHGERRTAAIQIRGLRKTPATARVTTLAGDAPGAENTLERPDAVAPRESELTVAAPEIEYTLEPHSLTTLRIRTN